MKRFVLVSLLVGMYLVGAVAELSFLRVKAARIRESSLPSGR